MVTLAIFAFTGIYMHFTFAAFDDGDAAVRFLFRANHIYILCAGLLNLVVGSALRHGGRSVRPRLRAAGSMLLLTAPPVLIWAFFTEPPRASPDRPFTLVGITILALGAVLHVAGRWRTRLRSVTRPFHP